MMKKIKHKMVEFMDTDSADALGLSRAILCNDPLLRKMKVLEDNTLLYRNLIGYFGDLFFFQEKISHFQKGVYLSLTRECRQLPMELRIVTYITDV
ncbi:unnamed protein product [Heligmosomoides polygyrus]|uniref:AH domain-containing protein n=1 Tax=Heligmosomoides polygyrus TaxID=6339 RepID=A0A183F8B0_HELPZ|nr:unnamed protein product [Heligmosomoides polygyrus]